VSPPPLCCNSCCQSEEVSTGNLLLFKSRSCRGKEENGEKNTRDILYERTKHFHIYIFYLYYYCRRPRTRLCVHPLSHLISYTYLRCY
jgi:hypothetical protein